MISEEFLNPKIFLRFLSYMVHFLMKMVSDITYRRLFNQKLVATFKNSAEVVHWFGAMQAQDFAAAKWAIAIRSKNQTDVDIEQAFNEGKILRTHIMRPTWHFVMPADIRWMLALTSPRVQAFNGYYYRKSGFDKTIFKKSNEIIKQALRGGKQLTSSELNMLLQKAKIPTKDIGLSYALMQAELEAIICSGPRRDKQFTYMLLDERVPKVKEISQDEALAELIKRYFQSHGPAQLRDFVWWSGLSVADAKKGTELVGSELYKEEREGKTYWCLESAKVVQNSQDGFLIPGFDEYFIAYKDRNDILDKKYAKYLNQGGGMVNGAIIVEGKMVGCWKRIFEKSNVAITIQLFKKVTSSQMHSFGKQVERYGHFVDMPASLHIMHS